VRDLHNGTSTLAMVLAILGIATAAQAEPQMYSASLILHSFANDATGALQALPFGFDCNPANGGKPCGSARIHKGAPLTGMGAPIITGRAPVSFQFSSSALSRKTSGSLPPYPGILYTLTEAKLANAAGIFGPGKGPGSFSFVPKLGAGQTHVAVIPGKNRFGGVMQLIGSFGTKVAGSTSGGGTWRGNFPTWGISVVGASYAKTARISGSITFSSGDVTYPSVAVVTGFPWTTGQVSVEAAGGYGFPTALVRSGYDNRTEEGIGTIQLVTPRLTHWSGGSHWGDVAILNVKFVKPVPEPKGWLMLAAGLGLLGAIYRARPKAR
jgi:hypothetical protein